MERWDNYAIAANQARQLFLNYDAQKLAEKLHVRLTDEYLYTRLFHEHYRIHRTSCSIQRNHRGTWLDANSFHEALTLLDLVCDSREDRCLSGKWLNMSAFGLQFHQHLTETRDFWAEELEKAPEKLRKACKALGGEPFPHGDIAYAIEVFDGLKLVLQLWMGDDEFPAQVRWLWDANAKMYIKYETMYYAIGLLKNRLKEEMDDV